MTKKAKFFLIFGLGLLTIAAAVCIYLFTSQGNKLTVNFLNYDETVFYSEKVESGASASGPSTTPTREGYTFCGWEDYSNISQSKNVKSLWTVNESYLPSDSSTKFNSVQTISILYTDWTQLNIISYVTNGNVANIKTILFTSNESDIPNDGDVKTVSVGATDVSGSTRLAATSSEYEDVTDVLAYVTSNADDTTKFDIVFYSPVTIYAPQNSSHLFSNLSGLTSITFDNFNTEKVTNMSNMFSHCLGLKEIDLSTFNTENVESMDNMFMACVSLTTLSLNNFKTKNVTNMRYMFSYCRSLENLDLNFDTSSVIYMHNMFSHCPKLKTVNFGEKFNTSNVENMTCMFSYCLKLETVNFGEKFNTAKVTGMPYMFDGCSSLKELDLSRFNTSNVIYMQSMFSGCSSLKNITFGDKFNTAKAQSMYRMFKNCSSLEKLDLSSFNTLNATNTATRTDPTSFLADMLSGCTALKEIKTPKVIGSGRTIAFPNPAVKWVDENNNIYSEAITSSMCGKTLKIAMESYFSSAWKTNTKLLSIVKDISKITKIEFSSTQPTKGTKISIGAISETSNDNYSESNTNEDVVDVLAYVTKLSSDYNIVFYSPVTMYAPVDSTSLFSGLTSLKQIVFDNFDTSRVVNMSLMFQGDKELTNLDLSSFNMSNVKTSTDMLAGCASLAKIVAPKLFAKGLTIQMPTFSTSAWHKQETGNLIADDVCTEISEENTVLIRCYTITFNANKGSINGNTIVKKVIPIGDVYSFPTNPTRENYNFTGWYTAEINGNKIYSTNKPSGDTTLYAHWKLSESYLSRTWKTKLLGEITNLAKINTITFTNSKPSKGKIVSVGATDDYGQILESTVDILAYITDTESGYDVVLYSPVTIYAPEDSSSLFKGLRGLTKITLNNFNTSKVTDMSYMFYDCSNLMSLDLSKLNTSNVLDMSYMFLNCSSLIDLDFTYLSKLKIKSSFSTSKVNNMAGMFQGCSNLISLNLSMFDMSNVISASDMLSGCNCLLFILTPTGIRENITVQLPVIKGFIWTGGSETETVKELPTETTSSELLVNFITSLN